MDITVTAYQFELYAIQSFTNDEALFKAISTVYRLHGPKNYHRG